jgi:ribosomal protein S27E
MVMRGEKQPKGNDWRKATIASAARYRSYERTWCEDCRHEHIVSADDLIEFHGARAEESFWHLAQRLKCGACGSIRVGIMAASYNRARDRPDNRPEE